MSTHSLVLAIVLALANQDLSSFEIVSTENDVAFVMVNANPQSTQDRLDGILAKPRKFVCINDDIDHSAPESVETLAVRRMIELGYPCYSSI